MVHYRITLERVSSAIDRGWPFGSASLKFDPTFHLDFNFDKR